VASGWHTVSVGHRKMVDALFAEEERLKGLGREPGVSGPSPGVNSMEFKVPVRPGDTVTYELVVTGKRASNSIAGWGLLFNKLTAVNQRGELVYRADLVGFSKLRDYSMPLRLKLLLALTKVPLIGPLLKRGS
jgi:acyl dehydratase